MGAETSITAILPDVCRLLRMDVCCISVSPNGGKTDIYILQQQVTRRRGITDSLKLPARTEEQLAVTATQSVASEPGRRGSCSSEKVNWIFISIGLIEFITDQTVLPHKGLVQHGGTEELRCLTCDFMVVSSNRDRGKIMFCLFSTVLISKGGKHNDRHHHHQAKKRL